MVAAAIVFLLVMPVMMNCICHKMALGALSYAVHVSARKPTWAVAEIPGGD
jgi:hypothetical protein